MCVLALRHTPQMSRMDSGETPVGTGPGPQVGTCGWLTSEAHSSSPGSEERHEIRGVENERRKEGGRDPTDHKAGGQQSHRSDSGSETEGARRVLACRSLSFPVGRNGTHDGLRPQRGTGFMWALGKGSVRGIQVQLGGLSAPGRATLSLIPFICSSVGR